MPQQKFRFNENRFITKRIVLFLSIFLSVATGALPTRSTGQVSAYYSSFTPLPQISDVPEPSITTPQEKMLVVSDEIGESLVPTPTPTPIWGKARQVDEHTWTLTVGRDDQMATPQDTLSALNVYRQQKGRGALSWDSGLADFAQKRADSFANNHTLDGHAGFEDFIHNQDGFNKLKFYALGENSSIGYHVTGTHLIEWVYAGDQPHDDNQLSTEWTHVGIGVNGDATDLVFGGKQQ